MVNLYKITIKEVIMTESHALIILFLVLIMSATFLSLMFKLRGVTAYNIFYVGVILFLIVGYGASFIWASEVPVLMGNEDLLFAIFLDVLVFWLISTVFLFVQTKNGQGIRNKNIPLGIQLKLQRTGNLLTIFTSVFVMYVLLSIDLSIAPLLNIGTYTLEEMNFYRSVLFQVPIVQTTYVLQYALSYLVIPFLFLLKGLGLKINRLALVLFLFFSLLTLSKTFIVMILVFYFLGRFVNTGKKIKIIQMAIVVTGIFFAIVYATYMVDVKRSFYDVTAILFIRMLLTPISLSAIYAEIFSFEDGLRRSSYYVMIFGGEVAPIATMAMKYVSAISTGNAPTGIIGTAYPNIPKVAHYLYYTIFIVFVWFGSNLANGIRNYYFNISLTAAFGILAWFLFLTDPLTALSSYSLLYIFVFVVAIRVLAKKSSRRAERKFKPQTITNNRY